MLTNVTRLRPGPQFSPEQAAAFAASLGAMINVGIEVLDVLGGDPDVEEDNEDCGHDEGEPDFSPSPILDGSVSGQLFDLQRGVI